MQMLSELFFSLSHVERYELSTISVNISNYTIFDVWDICECVGRHLRRSVKFFGQTNDVYKIFLPAQHLMAHNIEHLCWVYSSEWIHPWNEPFPMSSVVCALFISLHSGKNNKILDQLALAIFSLLFCVLLLIMKSFSFSHRRLDSGFVCLSRAKNELWNYLQYWKNCTTVHVTWIRSHSLVRSLTQPTQCHFSFIQPPTSWWALHNFTMTRMATSPFSQFCWSCQK